MNAILKAGVESALDSPKVAVGVSSAMISGGLTAKVSAFSSTISSTALLLGCLLSLVMIVTRLWKFYIHRDFMRLRREESLLRIEKLKREGAE